MDAHFLFQDLLPNGTLSIPFARSSSDQGVYQCFASTSSLGQSAAATPITLLISSGGNRSSGGEPDETSDLYSDEELAFWHRPALLDHLAAVPPSRPDVSQSGRTSALVEWTVDPSAATLSGEAMPIQVRRSVFYGMVMPEP